MKVRIPSFLVFCAAIVLIASCSEKLNYDYTPVHKSFSSDPYNATLTKSQYFEINADQDNVIEGEQGIIISIPKGAFYKEGNVKVSGTVKVELTEALHLSDMIFSNLTTMSNGNLLSTGGMFYVNFTQNDQQLVIDKEVPLYVQVPKSSNRDMMLYKGERDSLGNMNWKNPEAQTKYLITVPLESLVFTPEKFEKVLSENLPFKGVHIPTRHFIDSLYYSIVEYNALVNARSNRQPNIVSPKGEIINYSVPDSGSIVAEVAAAPMGVSWIQPYSVKALKGTAFESTFIATKAFETRIQAIHRTCRQDVLDLYADHLQDDLWKVDSLAADLLQGTKHEEIFITFAKEKLGNVKDASDQIHAKLLSDYYRRQSKKLESDIKKIYQEINAKEIQDERLFQEKIKEYNTILEKRERYQKEYYGYTLTESGWLNIDTGTVPKNWMERYIEIEVDNNEQFDLVSVYVWVPYNKSLVRLERTNKNLYKNQQRNKSGIPLDNNSEIQIISVAHKGDIHFFANAILPTANESRLSGKLHLEQKEKVWIDAFLDSKTNTSLAENNIQIDLSYNQYFLKHENQMEDNLNEKFVVNALYQSISLCCCADGPMQMAGEKLFSSACKACHSEHVNTQVVGSSFDYVLYNLSYEYFRDFTRNPAALIAKGDPDAVRVYHQFNKSLMPPSNLSDYEIRCIYEYLKAIHDCERSESGWQPDSLKLE